MPHVAVVVPWRGGCPHRERAWAWVHARYRERHPDWEIIEAGAPRGPWSKGAAVGGALMCTSAETIVVADADVWCDSLAPAVDHAARDRWAIPHRVVRRLTEDATGAFMAGGDVQEMDTVERPYIGMVGGGIVCLPRRLLEEVPIDPRFLGWGGEDESWGHALVTLGRMPWRGHGQLAHLFHPPQPRLTRRMGSLENEQLRARYARSRRNAGQTRALLEEVRAGWEDGDPRAALTAGGLADTY